MLFVAAGLMSTLQWRSADAQDAGHGAGPPPVHEGVDYWQPLWMQRELWGAGNMPKGMQARVLRHWTFTHYGIPDEYKNAKSPLGTSPEAIAAGYRLFARHCASCHGRQGMGDGVDSRSLLPSPALLAYMVQRPISVDPYLLWSIAEGGTAFGTEMPAFKGTLDRQQIWEIIAYMRAGFPQRAVPPKSGAK